MRNARGFSIIEVMVAVVVLGVGVLALAGGSVFVTRDLVRSRQTTNAALMAEARLETIRVEAGSTPVRCTSAGFTSASDVTEDAGVSMTWVVPRSGALRDVRVITAFPLGRDRIQVDTLTATVRC
jgi:prepilin-type N-terminal cleavage/methylation domain-containing protein